MRFNYRTAPLPALWTIILALVASPGAEAQGGPPGGMPPPPVRVAVAREMDLAPTIPIPGSVISRDDTRLAAEVAGRLVELAEIGTLVAAGDVVARVDDSLLRQRNVELAAEVGRVQARIGFLQREARRLDTLAAQDNAAERELDDTRSQLAIAQGELDVANARLAQNVVELERSNLRAPFDGQVTQRFVNPGERVTGGDLVVRVVGRDRIEVVARATIRAARYLYAGGRVTVRDITGHEGTGTVRTVVPFGDSSQHMYELRIDVDPEEWLVAQAVELAVPVATAERLLVVPRDSLVLRRNDTYVMRVNGDDQAERVNVTPGLSEGGLIAVTGGLKAGDRVVIRGAERLRPGQTVRVLADDRDSPAAEVSATD
jgi:RND family efflux transporter MFP subunit